MAKEDVLRKAARVWFHRTVYGPASQGQGPARSARARELDIPCTTSSTSTLLSPITSLLLVLLLLIQIRVPMSDLRGGKPPCPPLSWRHKTQ